MQPRMRRPPLERVRFGRLPRVAALLPMIGGETAVEGGMSVDASGNGGGAAPPDLRSVASAGRVRGLSVVRPAQGGFRGWLERQEEDGAEWVRRFFVLEQRVRDGYDEASIEYYVRARARPASRAPGLAPVRLCRPLSRTQGTRQLRMSMAARMPR